MKTVKTMVGGTWVSRSTTTKNKRAFAMVSWPIPDGSTIA